MSNYAIMLALSLFSTMPIIFNYSIHMAFGQELDIGAQFIRQENEFLYDDVRIDLKVNGMLEEGNRTANINAGTIGIGGNALLNPVYKYQVTNGTLHFGESTLLYLHATKVQ